MKHPLHSSRPALQRQPPWLRAAAAVHQRAGGQRSYARPSHRRHTQACFTGTAPAVRDCASLQLPWPRLRPEVVGRRSPQRRARRAAEVVSERVRRQIAARERAMARQPDSAWPGWRGARAVLFQAEWGSGPAWGACALAPPPPGHPAACGEGLFLCTATRRPCRLDEAVPAVALARSPADCAGVVRSAHTC